MAKIFYIGDWAIQMGPVFAETPFNYAYKGLETINHSLWLKNAIESSNHHSVTNIATWDFYKMGPGEYEKAIKGHPVFNRIDMNTLPPILGYNKVKEKEGFDVLAQWNGTSDPMVAAGKIKNGNVLAYTSDPAPHWGCNFIYWKDYSQFWLNIVNWLLNN